MAVADAMKLPYRACCDGVLCIAVLHHISSVDRRVRMLAELASILAPGGRAIVTVWATEQENMKKVAKWQPLAQGKGRSRSDAAQAQEDGGADGEGNDYLVPWHLPLHRAEAAAVSAKSVADAEMDVGKNALVFKRYYHLFGPEELEGLVARVPGVSVVDSFYDRDNWCVVFRKDG